MYSVFCRTEYLGLKYKQILYVKIVKQNFCGPQSDFLQLGEKLVLYILNGFTASRWNRVSCWSMPSSHITARAWPFPPPRRVAVVLKVILTEKSHSATELYDEHRNAVKKPFLYSLKIYEIALQRDVETECSDAVSQYRLYKMCEQILFAYADQL